MAATRTGGPRPAAVPNQAMRELRGNLSPREFATLVRRAAREIGEHVSCDARYVGRVEAGEIRCPNYAYQRVFRHMWPEKSLADLGFAARKTVLRRPGSAEPAAGPTTPAAGPAARPTTHPSTDPAAGPATPAGPPDPAHRSDEENDDVLRRTFLNGGPAAVAAALGMDLPPLPAAPPQPERRRVGAAELRSVEQAVRDIRLLDDAHGADALFELAGQSLRSAYVLLNDGEYNAATERRLQCGAGELAISVGWLAHDSNRLMDARSFYSEALATARMAQDAGLEAHVFSNSAFLARDAGRPGRPCAPRRPGRPRPPGWVRTGCCPCCRCARRAAGRCSAIGAAAGGRWPGRTRCSTAARGTPTRSGCPSSGRRSSPARRRSAGRRSASGSGRAPGPSRR
ncbi:hypothetical protein KCH_28590 [Kitasatospora cheerisanensis KCTC 2395]|uniref:Transcriptional regulator n=1 Tax=Kitasatospora cheerisanensis KCTC 2395 TaxID=1348663 RepID=A0A066YUR3_9ACTN|nr:hypothetical protein KCH_28590 [Kitasatospora cheerisanensis KCTC 2395]